MLFSKCPEKMNLVINMKKKTNTDRGNNRHHDHELF